MNTAYQIVVCAGIVPDPLQTLEPIASPTGPALKNERCCPLSSIRSSGGSVERRKFLFNFQMAAFY